MNTIEWPEGTDLPIFIGFTEAGEVVAPMCLDWKHAADAVLAHHRRTGEHGTVVRYTYDRFRDSSEWVGTEWRSRERLGTRRPQGVASG